MFFDIFTFVPIILIVVIYSASVVTLTTSCKWEKCHMPKVKDSAKETQPTSIRLPNHLYQQLEQKSQEWGGIGMSKTIQLLLQAAMENPPDRDQSKYGAMTYTLLREAILSLVEDGDGLIDRATQRAHQIISNTLTST